MVGPKEDPELIAKVRAEIEKIYEANTPQPGDARHAALAIADELQRALDRYVDSLRRNDSDAATSAQCVRRMRRALHRVATEEDVAPTVLVPMFKALRHFASMDHDKRVVIATMREHFAEHLEDWTDGEIWKVLSAANFNVAMARALTEHDYPMGESNVARLVRGRKSKRAMPRRTH